MAIFTANITYREGSSIPLSTFIASVNTVFDAFEAVGMQKVSDAEFPGQCGRLVNSDPGPGETLKDEMGTWTLYGAPIFNVYKHPASGLFIKANAYDTGYYQNTNRVLTMGFEVFWAIQDGEAVAPTLIRTTTDDRGGSSSAHEKITAGPVLLRASMDDNHFWICCAGAISPQSLSTSTSISYLDRYAPFSFSPIAFATFFQENRVVATTHTTIGRSQALLCLGRAVRIDTQINTESADVDYRLSAARYWAAAYGNVFEFVGGAACGYIDASTKSLTDKGLRVKKAGTVAASKFVEPDFCMLPWGAVSDGDVLTIDLDGAGPRKYIVCGGFGNQNPAPVVVLSGYAAFNSLFPESMFTVAAMPWEE